MNLGAVVNSDQTEFCPMLTPDGKYLFFSRRYGNTWNESKRCEILWIDAGYLELFRIGMGR